VSKSLKFHFKTKRIDNMVKELEERKQACEEAIEGTCRNCSHLVGTYPDSKVLYHLRGFDYSTTCFECWCRKAEL
jgi:hypothetical protein